MPSKDAAQEVHAPVSITTSRLRIAFAALAALALVLVPAALAGKGKPGGSGAGSSSTLRLVLLNSADGLPHYGQRVTFSISTTASRPFVSLNCYQGGAWVYTASVGYFPEYPWAKEFTLAGTSWPGGAADCTARLYTTKDGRRTTTLATLGFHVYA
jgi:hypothetical protein